MAFALDLTSYFQGYITTVLDYFGSCPNWVIVPTDPCLASYSLVTLLAICLLPTKIYLHLTSQSIKIFRALVSQVFTENP